MLGNINSIINIMSIASAMMLIFMFIIRFSAQQKASIFIILFLTSLVVEIVSVMVEKYILLPRVDMLTIVFILLYVRKLVHLKVKCIHGLLFIPFLLSIFNINFIQKDYVFHVFNIGLLIYILFFTQQVSKKLTDFYTNLENRELRWVQKIAIIFLLFHLYWIIEDIFYIFSEKTTIYFSLGSSIFTLLLMYWIAYYGFTQKNIFYLKPNYNETNHNNKKNNLSDAENEVFKKIVETIIVKKYFLISDLNLKTLSEKLNTSEKELSKLINKNTQKNFYHFINKFRIDEFKKLMSDKKYKQFSILGLAQEAGFSSKSTFYAVFKNIEGKTPKQYQQQITS